MTFSIFYYYLCGLIGYQAGHTASTLKTTPKENVITEEMNSNAFLNILDTIDRSITVSLNFNGGAFQDNMWMMFSSRLIWVLPAIALIAYLLSDRRTRRKTLIVVIALTVVVTLCDQTTSALMKPFFARLRPSHTPGVENMLHYVNGYRGGQYGFASSHAANSFGAVTFVALLLRRWKVTVALLLLSLCVCYSRIYLGVHFFGDIFVGAVIGVMFGYIVYAIVSADWSAAYRHIAHFRFRTALR